MRSAKQRSAFLHRTGSEIYNIKELFFRYFEGGLYVVATIVFIASCIVVGAGAYLCEKTL